MSGSFKVSLGQAGVTPLSSRVCLSREGLNITVSSPGPLENIQIEVTEDSEVPSAGGSKVVYGGQSNSRFFRVFRSATSATMLLSLGTMFGIGAGGLYDSKKKDETALSTPIPQNEIPDMPLLKAPIPLVPKENEIPDPGKPLLKAPILPVPRENTFDPKPFNLFGNPFLPKKNEIRDLDREYGRTSPEFKPLEPAPQPSPLPNLKDIFGLEKLLHFEENFDKLLNPLPPPEPLLPPKPLSPKPPTSKIEYEGIDVNALSEENLKDRGNLYQAIQKASESQKKPLIAKYAKSAVVFISMGRPGANKVGTGWICHSDDNSSLIITNQHVATVSSTDIVADEIDVTLMNGKKVVGKVVETSKEWDLALIEIDEKNLPALKLSEDELEVGESVVAFGDPDHVGLSMTSGIVSGNDRIFRKSGLNIKLIQTDAAINRGNSGGPLLNMKGDVIAVNTFILRGEVQGISFCVPVVYAKNLMTKWQKRHTSL